MASRVSPGDIVHWYPYYNNSAEIRALEMNLNGVIACQGNPNVYDGGESGNRAMHTSSPYSNRYRKSATSSYTPSQWNVPKDLYIRAEDHNKIARDVLTVAVRIKEAVRSSVEPSELIVNPGYSTIVAQALNYTAQRIEDIDRILSNYDHWFDANGVCSLSCQVECMVNCQVHCMSCHGGQCHDKNCALS